MSQSRKLFPIWICSSAITSFAFDERQRKKKKRCIVAAEEEAHGNTLERKFVQEILHAFSDPGCKRPLTCIPNGHERTPNFQFFCLSSPVPSYHGETTRTTRLTFKTFASFHLKLPTFVFYKTPNNSIQISNSAISSHEIILIRI